MWALSFPEKLAIWMVNWLALGPFSRLSERCLLWSCSSLLLPEHKPQESA